MDIEDLIQAVHSASAVSPDVVESVAAGGKAGRHGTQTVDRLYKSSFEGRRAGLITRHELWLSRLAFFW